MIERFRKGEDPYLPMAKALGAERQFGKVVELACGYGMGPDRLASHMKAAGLMFKEGFPERAVSAYRETHPAVAGLWREAGIVLNDLANRHMGKWWRFLEIDAGRLVHPNGTWLDYSGLKWDSESGEWRLYGRYSSWRKMYGAKLVENVVQWLSRIVTGEAMVKFAKAGYPVVGMSHDDVWLLVPDNERDQFDHHDRIVAIMSETPFWAPGLPLASACKMGETYE